MVCSDITCETFTQNYLLIRFNRVSFLENAEDVGLTTPYAVCRELASLRCDKSSATSLQESITELTSNQEALLADAEKKVCLGVI